MPATLLDDRDVSHIAPPRSGSITPRSLLIGTIAALLICGLTPFNDYVLSDTNLTAGFMPLGAILIEFFLIVGINAPLHKLAPRWALSGGELAVIVLMTLVSCGIPSWGLMKFFIPTTVAPFHIGASDDAFWKPFVEMGLPAWLFPVPSISEGRTSPIVTWFYTRVPQDEQIPWRAWIVPLCVWGIFVVAMFATLAAI